MPIQVITTGAALEALVVKGRPESLRLEFKSKIDGWGKGVPDRVKKEAQRELCRDISQMANSIGGHVVYGVAEERAPDGVKIAGDWAPLADPEAFKAWIDEAIMNFCVPSTFSKEVHLVDIDGGRVIVATIQPSRSMVYVWDRGVGTIECMTRTSTGKKYMNPDEMERHLMDGTRAAKLAFDEAWETRKSEDVVVSDGIWSHGKLNIHRLVAGPLHIGSRDQSTFELRVPVDGARRVVAIPYSLITHVWVDGQSRLTLMLGARLVYEGNEFSLRHVG